MISERQRSVFERQLAFGQGPALVALQDLSALATSLLFSNDDRQVATPKPPDDVAISNALAAQTESTENSGNLSDDSWVWGRGPWFFITPVGGVNEYDSNVEDIPGNAEAPLPPTRNTSTIQDESVDDVYDGVLHAVRGIRNPSCQKTDPQN